jgi:hypothetical protein
MLTLDQYKTQLSRWYERDEIGLCLESLQKTVKNNWGNTHKRLLEFSRQYHSNQVERGVAILDTKEALHQGVRIGSGLLDMIGSLDDDDVDLTALQTPRIYPAIVLVAASDAALTAALTFFPGAVYDKVRPVVDAEFDHNLHTNTEQLVVFANLRGHKNNQFEGRIKRYLDQPEAKAFYFGERLDLLDNYPDKVYAANSQFSLDARIREMLDYLRTRGENNSA